jgi:ankyrin repeat protein
MWKVRQAEGAEKARVDALMKRKTDDLIESFLVDDNAKMLSVFRDVEKYDFALRQGKFLLPKILRNGSNAIMVASFLGAIRCVRTLNDLSVDLKLKDKFDLTVAHFACAGGSFDVCRELDNLGVDFSVGSKRGSPAKFACEYGRDELLMWLWTRGSILGDPRIGWSAKRGSDPDVLCAAALNGHSKVIRILLESVGIKFTSELGVNKSAVTSACRNGHDEALEVMFELGASVNASACGGDSQRLVQVRGEGAHAHRGDERRREDGRVGGGQRP